MSQYDDSPARRALGARDAEGNNVVVVETTRKLRPIPVSTGPTYSRRSYKTPLGKKLYEATGGGGIICVRASATPMRYATDVADPAGATERQRRGRIWGFFPTEEHALAQADALRAQGLVVTIVEARPYAGQGESDE